MNRSMILAAATMLAAIGTTATAAPRQASSQERAATRELNNQQLAMASNPGAQPAQQQSMQAMPSAAADTSANAPMTPGDTGQPGVNTQTPPEAVEAAPPQS